MLSVTIATKDESENIINCLKSVSFADEVFIVDDCSRDDTVQKAKDFGARILIRESGGSFHENKNLAISEAHGDWILSLDADEIVSKELSNSIQNVLMDPVSDGYLIDRHNYFLGKWIRGCGWYPDNILRLFRKGKAWWPLEIHDTPTLERGNEHAPVLKGPLIHKSYKDLDQFFEKFNRYTTRLALEYTQRNYSPKGIHLPINLFIRPTYWFLRKYIFLQGFRDGFLGFFICFCSGLTIFVSYAKFLQLVNDKMKV